MTLEHRFVQALASDNNMKLNFPVSFKTEFPIVNIQYRTWTYQVDSCKPHFHWMGAYSPPYMTRKCFYPI